MIWQSVLIVQWVSSWASSLSFPSSRAPADGENSYIAGFVHIGQEPGDGNVADGLFEEHLLYGGRADRAEGRQQQEELTKTTRLSRVPGVYITVESELGFILQSSNSAGVAEAS